MSHTNVTEALLQARHSGRPAADQPLASTLANADAAYAVQTAVWRHLAGAAHAVARQEGAELPVGQGHVVDAVANGHRLIF